MLKSIIRFSLNNKWALFLMSIIIVAMSIIATMNMKMETIPSIKTPVITVTTVYPGTTPEDVEDEISIPIEERVNNLSGVESVTSRSMENASAVTIQYDFSTDMSKAEDEVNDALESIEFPEGVDVPKGEQMSFGSFPIISYSIGSSEVSIKDMTKIAEDELIKDLKGIDGIQDVTLQGQLMEEVQLSFDQDKLKSEGLSEDQVLQYIKGATTNAPLGLYTFGDELKNIVVDGQFSSIEALKGLKIPNQQQAEQMGEEMKALQQKIESGEASPEEMKQAQQATESNAMPSTKLSDVAKIDKVSERESIAKTNGKDALSVQITKSDDANTVTVANEVKDVMKSFVKAHQDIEVNKVMDQAEPIETSIKTMVEKALVGIIFAVIVILVFLRDVRSTLIASVSIPLSLLVALLILKNMDITLNIMTLGALTVAIGRVVDDSIVVIENIYRRMTLKDEPLTGKELVIDATKEMYIPIMSSTMVTIAVFLPLGLVGGEVGELFRPFAYAVVFALLASLLIAVTIAPMLAHMFFKRGVKHSTSHEQVGFIAKHYRSILKYSLNHKWLVSILSVLLLVGSLMLVPFVGTSFIDTGGEKMIAITYKPAPGETDEAILEHADVAEAYFLNDKDVKNVMYTKGENPMSPGDSSSVAFFVKYEDDTEEFESKGEKALEQLAKENSDGEFALQDFATGGTANSYAVTIKGDSRESIRDTVNEVKDILDNEEQLSNVSSSLSETYEEYQIEVNHDKASDLGLSAGQIAMALNQRSMNNEVTEINQQKDEPLKVVLHKEKDTEWTEEKLESYTIQSPMGESVKLSDISTLKQGETSDTIIREDGEIAATVEGKINSDDVSVVSKSVNEALDELDTPSGVDVSVGGTTEDINESFSQLGLAMLAAIGIVYLILVLTFKGALAPFAVLFSLPFTIIGSILGLLMTGETISVPVMIGILMLIGIVVTNAIVLIDRVINMEKEGLTTRDALLEAATIRVRPILMTALATIGALLPLLLPGEGSILISKALAVTVIGGLTSSTILTLIVVPVVYEVLMRIKKKFIKA